MSGFKRFAKYFINNPKLYRIYPPRPSPNPSQDPQPPPLTYSPSFLESLSDATITYVLPLTLILSVYQRKVSYLQVTILLYVASRFIRSLSRLTNREYIQFLSTLDRATENLSDASLRELRLYDFEFKYFPVLHNCTVDVGDYVRKQEPDTGVMYYVSWLVAHTFGIRMIYPGLLLGGVLRSVLEDGRGKLVVDKKGDRVKIRVGSEDGGVLDVDAMVFDKRGGSSPNGDVLMVICEGNAGFYEIGMLGGALAEGFSVLGWNHPGFGGSTGVPYPAKDLTAAMGVMDYATNVLGFKESSIVIYAWSIGGFPATYLAARFPKARGVILDATFDSVLPLALPRMPDFMSSLVESTIKSHVNLDNLENLRGYKGPIRMVRRTDDEIIADPPGVLVCNRGNNLIVEYVLDRYGKDVSDSARAKLVDWVNEAHDRDAPAFDNLAGDDTTSIVKGDDGEQLVAMAASILRDWKSTHCTPLSREFYRITK